MAAHELEGRDAPSTHTRDAADDLVDRAQVVEQVRLTREHRRARRVLRRNVDDPHLGTAREQVVDQLRVRLQKKKGAEVYLEDVEEFI